MTEEYLECIYRLQEQDGAARTSEIVKVLQVAPGTVTNTVKRLEKLGLLTHEPYRGVALTEEGRRIAVQVVRRHRLLERLLTDILQVEWEDVHEEACKLEHGIANGVLKKVDKALGHPRTCPHGNPIPTGCGGILEEESVCLTGLELHESGIVAKITEEDGQMLKYLASMGIKPEASVKVVEKAPFNGPITVNVDGSDHALSRKVASIIKVRKK